MDRPRRCNKGSRSTGLRVAPDRWQAEAHAGDPASPVSRATCPLHGTPSSPCATTVDSAPHGQMIGPSACWTLGVT